MKPVIFVILVLLTTGCASTQGFTLSGILAPSEKPKKEVKPVAPTPPTPEEMKLNERDRVVAQLCSDSEYVAKLRSYIDAEKAAAKESGFIHGGEVQTAVMKVKAYEADEVELRAEYEKAYGPVGVYTCPPSE